VQRKGQIKLNRSPNALTVERLEAMGWVADSVERWCGKIRKDWCGWADIIGFYPPTGAICGFQPTSLSNVSSHIEKVRNWDHLETWLQAGHGAQVWGWYKLSSRIVPADEQFQVRIENITLEGIAS